MDFPALLSFPEKNKHNHNEKEHKICHYELIHNSIHKLSQLKMPA